ncbi:MAG: hypothetical protein OHK0021_19780 [Bryobacter sp.]
MRLFFVLVFALPLLAQIGPCRVPAQGERTRPTRTDWVNRDTRTDYFALALSWSPAFCAESKGSRSQRWQCQENSFGFVVHGLWPQSAAARSGREHPRHCQTATQLPPEATRPYLCTLPGAQLAQDQWVKHGSCAWPDAASYFRQIEKLYQSLTLADPPSGRHTAGALKQGFARANAARGLRPEHLQIRVRPRNQFSEILVCYDEQFRFRACPASGNTPDRVEVFVTPRGK